MATTLVQLQYRFRTDTLATNTAATFGAALNTTYFPGILPFRIRFTVNSTGSPSPSSQTYNLAVSKNSGAYGAINGSSGVLSSSAASASADNASITSAQLPVGTGVFIAGQYDNTGATAAQTLPNGDYTEFEFGLILDFTNLNNSDTLDFRIYQNGTTTALNTYTQTPRVTVEKRSFVPLVGSLALSGTPVRSQSNLLVPTVGSLTLTGATPTITSYTLYPASASLALSGTPIRSQSNILVPPAGALALTTAAPVEDIFAAGQYDNTGETAALVIPAEGYTELEFGLILDEANISIGDTLSFSVFANGVRVDFGNTRIVAPAIPASVSLTLSGAAPTVTVSSSGTNLVPAAASLALTGNVPVEKFSIVVPVGSLALSSDAPTSVQNIIETPSAASLVLTGNVPVELFSIQVPAAALALSGTTSTVVQNLSETPAAASLALSSAAPTSVQNLLDTPAAGTLTLSTAAPTAVQNIPASPASASLALTGTVPIIKWNLVVPAGGLTLTADAPTVQSNNQINLTPLAASLNLTGTFPVPGIPVGTLTLSSTAPVVSVAYSLQVPAGMLALSSDAPTAVQNLIDAPAAGALSLSTTAPAVVTNIPASPSSGSLALSGAAPSLVSDERFSPASASAVLTAGTPVASQNIILTPPAGTLALSASAPTAVSGIALVVPAGGLTLAGIPPVITGIFQVPPTGQGDVIWPWWWQQGLYVRNGEARGDIIYAWAELLPGEAKGNAKSDPDQAAAASLVIAGIAAPEWVAPARLVTSSATLFEGKMQGAGSARGMEFVVSAQVDSGIASVCGYASGAALMAEIFVFEDDEPQRIAA